MEDNKCLNLQDVSGVSCMNFNRVSSSHHRIPLGKPTPSKWDDAQKWLVNLSKKPAKSSPRNSNADDRRLIVSIPKKDFSSGDELQTKNVQCEEESIWRINKQIHNSKTEVGFGSICVRDMGTEMTPIGSQEPSRTATPIRASTPVAQSLSSSPVRPAGEPMPLHKTREVVLTSTNLQSSEMMNPLEIRAIAWDEAERAKYVARYKREEVKIQARENHEKMTAELEMRKVEVRAEKLKACAQENYAKKLAAVRRKAEERRANAEEKLNKTAVKISERADHIRRTGHLPSPFSLKVLSFCW